MDQGSRFSISVEDQVLLRSFHSGGATADLWFLHGFGESGLCYREAFDSPLSERYRLFVPDLPGFGASPPRESAQSLDGQAYVLAGLVDRLSSQRPVILIGHSMGSLIAVRLAQQQAGTRVVGLVSIEGNLTPADAFLTGKTAEYAGPEDFALGFRRYIVSQLGEETALYRYYASLWFADPRTLWNLGRDTARESRSGEAGQRFLQLECRKLYCWGEASLGSETRNFLGNNGLRSRKFATSGHWPMIDEPAAFYTALAEDLANLAQ